MKSNEKIMLSLTEDEVLRLHQILTTERLYHDDLEELFDKIEELRMEIRMKNVDKEGTIK